MEMDEMSKAKAERVLCPDCGQLVLTYVSKLHGDVCIKGHCKPGTDPRKSIGCDCPGSYKLSPAAFIARENAFGDQSKW
jgi:hypothetical protein